MPELPEVETIRKDLLKYIKNKTILNIEVYYENTLGNISSKDFISQVKQQTISDVKRYGKWLIFVLNDYLMLVHLRMEGKFIINPEPNKHTHVLFELDGIKLGYNDVRKFGRILLFDKCNYLDLEVIKKMGIECNDNKLTLFYMKDKFKNKSIPIKTVLLDQTIISGIGNIYANEILFASKINPYRSAKTLVDKEIENIIINSKKIINNAIESKGTTIRTYQSLSKEGNYQEQLRVHGKENELCLICNSKIIREKINGRSAYYCPKCQK